MGRRGEPGGSWPLQWRMRTWADLQSYARDKYWLAEDLEDRFALIFAIPGGRTQQPRDLQEKGTRSSSPQLRQQVRTKPSSKSPQPAKPSSSAFTNAGSGPARSSQRSRNSARWRRTSTAASHSWV